MLVLVSGLLNAALSIITSQSANLTADSHSCFIWSGIETVLIVILPSIFLLLSLKLHRLKLENKMQQNLKKKKKIVLQRQEHSKESFKKPLKDNNCSGYFTNTKYKNTKSDDFIELFEQHRLGVEHVCFYMSVLLILAALPLHPTQGKQSMCTENRNQRKHGTFIQRHTRTEGASNAEQSNSSFEETSQTESECLMKR